MTDARVEDQIKRFRGVAPVVRKQRLQLLRRRDWMTEEHGVVETKVDCGEIKKTSESGEANEAQGLALFTTVQRRDDSSFAFKVWFLQSSS